MFANFKTDEIFDFNFIYGIVRPSNDEYVMELLDGQQRMTTLFLVYWYIANCELTEEMRKIRSYVMLLVALSMKHVPLPLYFVISLLPIVLICLAKHHQE
jgi:hypothetical protein